MIDSNMALVTLDMIMLYIVLFITKCNAYGCGDKQLDFNFELGRDDSIFTPMFKFKTFGSPNLYHDKDGTVVQFLKQGQYIELPSTGIECVQDMARCNGGFTLSIRVQFHEIPPHKIYILSSGGDQIQYNGIALYVDSAGFLVCSVKQNNTMWTSKKLLNVALEEWHTYTVTWKQETGFIVYKDGEEFFTSITTIGNPNQPITSSLLFAKGSQVGSTETTLMDIRDLYVWTTSLDDLIKMGCSVDLGTNNEDKGEEDEPVFSFWFQVSEVLILITISLIVLMSLGCICRKCCCFATISDDTEEESTIVIKRDNSTLTRKKSRDTKLMMKNIESIDF